MKISIKRQIAVYGCLCLIFCYTQKKSMAVTMDDIEEFYNENSVKTTAFFVTFTGYHILKELIIEPIKTYMTNNLLEHKKQLLQIEQQKLAVYEKHADNKINDNERNMLLKNLNNLQTKSKTSIGRKKSLKDDIEQLKDDVKQLQDDVKQLKDSAEQLKNSTQQLKDTIDAFGSKLDVFLPKQDVQQTQTISHEKDNNP